MSVLPKSKPFPSDLGQWQPFGPDIRQMPHTTGPIRLGVQPAPVYALMAAVLGLSPNGPYTAIATGYPLDNPFWWDFVIKNGDEFLHIWRTNSWLEANFCFSDSSFDPDRFLRENLSRYGKAVGKQIQKYEKHTLLQNHVKSYRDILELLTADLAETKIQKPKPIGHFGKEEEWSQFQKELFKYRTDVIRHHVTAKSIVLYSAFYIEGIVNALLTLAESDSRVRVFRRPSRLIDRLRFFVDREGWSKRTRKRVDDLKFKDRVKLLHQLTPFLSGPLETTDAVIIDAHEVMSLRGEFAHGRLVSQGQCLGTVSFDGKFPLHPVSEDVFVVRELANTYLFPTTELATWAYQTATSFAELVESKLSSEYRERVLQMLAQNPIGHRKDTGTFSAVSPNEVFHSYLTIK